DRSATSFLNLSPTREGGDPVAQCLCVTQPTKLNEVNPAHLAVCGTAKGVARVEAWVAGWLGCPIARGQTVVQPPNWVVMFPFIKAKPGRQYTLHVRGISDPITLVMPIPFRKPTFPPYITFPDIGDSLCHINCAATGTTTGTDPVQGTLTIDKADGSGTATVSGMPGTAFGSWFVQFTDLPTSKPRK